MNRKALITIISVMLVTGSMAASYYTKGTGDWETNSIWGVTTATGVGSMFSTLTLVAGDKIYIDDNITLNTNLTIGVDVTIYLNSNLVIDGKLNLTANSTIVFQSSSAHVYGTPPGNSDQIKIGPGNTVWSTNDGTITGPGVLNSSSSGGSLPVELLFFTTKINASDVLIQWATATELNFDFFVLDKSSNGEDFINIGKITGHGTTHERNDYSFVDANPVIGKNYYRLTSVDFDGYTETFKVISVNYDAEKYFSVYPNPSNGNPVHVKLNYKPEGQYIIAIYDNLGNILRKINSKESDQNMVFDSASSGTYFAKLITEDFVEVERFIVE